MADPTPAAVVVTYEPDLRHLERALALLVPQVGEVVVVDNGSTNQTQLAECLTAFGSVSIVANQKNQGIAGALNQGVLRASEGSQREWVLTLDQDSLVPPGLVNELCKARAPKVAVVAPEILDRAEAAEEAKPEDWQPHLQGYEAVPQVITSGALTSVQAWRELGGFDEDMFIDLVDFDFCARARRAGWEIRQARGVALWHQLGRLEVRRVAGREVRVTHHAPWRSRQYARNTVYLARKLERRWWPPHLWRSLLHRTIKVALFEQQPAAGLWALFRGSYDGARASVVRPGQ